MKLSIRDLDAFWSSVWAQFEVRSVTDPGPALADATMPGARWFPDARLNWAEHALRLAQRLAAILAAGDQPRLGLLGITGEHGRGAGRLDETERRSGQRGEETDSGETKHGDPGRACTLPGSRGAVADLAHSPGVADPARRRAQRGRWTTRPRPRACAPRRPHPTGPAQAGGMKLSQASLITAIASEKNRLNESAQIWPMVP